MSDISLEMTKLRLEIQDRQEKLQVYARERLSEFFLEIFEKYPNLKDISWTQYTDYFNDGDLCTFSVHAEDSLIINGYQYYEIIYEKNKEEVLEEVGLTLEEFEEIAKTIDSLLYNSIGEDILETIFGDHVKVNVTKDGISTESYTRHD